MTCNKIFSSLKMHIEEGEECITGCGKQWEYLDVLYEAGRFDLNVPMEMKSVFKNVCWKARGKEPDIIAGKAGVMLVQLHT